MEGLGLLVGLTPVVGVGGGNDTDPIPNFASAPNASAFTISIPLIVATIDFNVSNPVKVFNDSDSVLNPADSEIKASAEVSNPGAREDKEVAKI